MTSELAAVAVVLVVGTAVVLPQEFDRSPEEAGRVDVLMSRTRGTDWFGIFMNNDSTVRGSYDTNRFLKIDSGRWHVWNRWDFTDNPRVDWMFELERVDCRGKAPAFQTIRRISYQAGIVVSDDFVSMTKPEVPDSGSAKHTFYRSLCAMLPVSLAPRWVGRADIPMVVSPEEHDRAEELYNRIDADRWKFIRFNRDFQSMTSYDRRTLTNAGAAKWRAWVRWDNADDPNGIHHTLEQTVVDCKRMTTYVLGWADYDKDGNVTSSGTFEPDKVKVKPIIPESVGESVFTEFCKLMPKPKPPKPEK